MISRNNDFFDKFITSGYALDRKKTKMINNLHGIHLQQEESKDSC